MIILKAECDSPTIGDAAEDACTLALRLGCAVEFAFNYEMVRVNPGDRPHEVVETYMKKWGIRDAKRGNADGGKSTVRDDVR